MASPSYQSALIVGAGRGLSASLARLFAARVCGWRSARAIRKSSRALCAETGAKAFACDAIEPGPGGADVPSGRGRNRRARRRRLQCQRAGPRSGRRAGAGRGRAGHHGQRLWRFPRGARGGGPDGAQRARRDPVHRRLGERQGLSALGGVRDGQIRAARPRAEHGARAGATRHPHRRIS